MSDHHVIVHRLLGGSADQYTILGLSTRRKTDVHADSYAIGLEDVMAALRALNPDTTTQDVWRDVLQRTGTLILDRR